MSELSVELNEGNAYPNCKEEAVLSASTGTAVAPRKSSLPSRVLLSHSSSRNEKAKISECCPNHQKPEVTLRGTQRRAGGVSCAKGGKGAGGDFHHKARGNKRKRAGGGGRLAMHEGETATGRSRRARRRKEE